MKTSYFARLKDIKYPISISGKAPDFYTKAGLPEYKVLAPSYSIFSEYKYEGPYHLDEAHYTERYNKERLGALEINKVLSDLQAKYPGVPLDEMTLLCYEKPRDFCHRHLVAEWLRKHGIPVEEQTFSDNEPTINFTI